MAAITIAELEARHARLVTAREGNQKNIRALQESLVAAQQREHGFMFVLGEMESMIAELAARAKVEQESAALAEQLRLTTEQQAAVVE